MNVSDFITMPTGTDGASALIGAAIDAAAAGAEIVGLATPGAARFTGGGE